MKDLSFDEFKKEVSINFPNLKFEFKQEENYYDSCQVFCAFFYLERLFSETIPWIEIRYESSNKKMYPWRCYILVSPESDEGIIDWILVETIEILKKEAKDALLSEREHINRTIEFFS